MLGRPPSEKTLVDRQLGRNKPVILMESFHIPNHSGDLSAGDVLKTPIQDTDPVNKKYVDDEIAAIPAPDLSAYMKLDQTTPQTTTGTFNFPKVLINGATYDGVSDLQVDGLTTSTSIGTYTLGLKEDVGSMEAEVLVVGGGGGGSGGTNGINYGGGGAGGIVRTNIAMPLTVQTYSVVVGDGGTGTLGGSNAGNGNSSSFNGLVATGGEGNIYDSRYGGSNADYSGGYSDDMIESYSAGGGAGAGADGSEKNGGMGVSNSISGSLVGYGGGGGGNPNGSSGGYGGGDGSTVHGTSGTTNTGGGGGGGDSGNGGGDGGSGIVIIRYLTADITATGGTITTDGDYTIHTFTTNGDFEVTSVTGTTTNIRDVVLHNDLFEFEKGLNAPSYYVNDVEGVDGVAIPVFNDGLTSGQLTSLTISKGIIIDYTTIP